MNDIVERLRACLRFDEPKGSNCESEIELAAREAADEIERLRAELAAAKAVIENIVVSEVEPLKALLLEVARDLIEVMRMPNQEHVADAHNEAVRRIRAALGDEQ